MKQFARTAIALGAAVVTAAGVAVSGGSAQAATVKLSPTGTVQVTYRGNGHGHGVSQYGAYGAALAGRTYTQIVHFYYRGSKLHILGPTAIRVRLSDTGTTTTVQAYGGIHLSGRKGYLPSAGVHRYRLVADSGTGITLQKLMWNSSRWVTVSTGLPNGTWFHRVAGLGLRLVNADGTSTFYDHYLKAFRSSAKGTAGGVYTVNQTDLETYAAGVTPREMPASWSRAAVDAQAVAARTYGYYYVQHPMTGTYDICDTPSCQVFGGTQHYDRSAKVDWVDYPQAATDTANRVLTYHGSTIFAQFAASNGGWTTDGGQPYLPAQYDPYDPGKSGDPYIDATKTMKVSTLAKNLGLTTVTGVTITARDGHGQWGGRVLTAVVTGTSGKRAVSQTVSGYDLQSAFGLGTTWLDIAPAS